MGISLALPGDSGTKRALWPLRVCERWRPIQFMMNAIHYLKVIQAGFYYMKEVGAACFKSHLLENWSLRSNEVF